MFKYQLIERKNPLDSSVSKWYASPVQQGIMEMVDIAKEISGRSTTTYPDILSVLQNFLEYLPFLMKLGYSVRLSDFGILRITFSSEGVEDRADFDISKISQPRVIFFTSPKLRKEIKDIKYIAAK